MADKKKRKNSDTARRIWLAGIGAYGKAYTEAKETLKGVAGDGSEVFDDLVQKGQMIEMAVGMKSKEMLGKAGVADLKMPDLSMPDLHIDDRIKKMRDRIKSSAGFDDAPVAETADRLDALEAKLDEILAILKPTPKRAPAKKKAASKKRASKKTVAKKTVTKKTPSKKE